MDVGHTLGTGDELEGVGVHQVLVVELDLVGVERPHLALSGGCASDDGLVVDVHHLQADVDLHRGLAVGDGDGDHLLGRPGIEEGGEDEPVHIDVRVATRHL